MARPYSYDENKILVRHLKELTIVFWDTETIYVLDKNSGMRHIFHRWFLRQRGYYTASWAPFRDELKKRKGLTVMKIYKMANYYGIAYSADFRTLDYKSKDVEHKND